jgi:hypothetical protein
MLVALGVLFTLGDLTVSTILGSAVGWVLVAMILLAAAKLADRRATQVRREGARTSLALSYRLMISAVAFSLITLSVVIGAVAGDARIVLAGSGVGVGFAMIGLIWWRVGQDRLRRIGYRW